MLKKITWKKTRKMILGILLIGIGVGVLRISNFGVDPFTCMDLGISQFLGMSFGTWQLIMNLLILLFVFFLVPHFIGLGTCVNMIGVGYIADFFCWLLQEQMQLICPLPIRILMLALGGVLVSLGCALYMNADLGIAPYDCVAYIIEKLTKGKIPFSKGRIISDVTVVCVGIIFGLMANANMSQLIGIGTVLNALLNGPMIQFFKTLTGGQLSRPRMLVAEKQK